MKLGQFEITPFEKDIFVTVLASRNYDDDATIGDYFILNKEKDNLHDDEAIIAADFDIEESEDLADIIEVDEEDARYVANSVNTVARGTYSAGRLYDKFNKNLVVKVIFAVHGVFICEVMGELTE